METVVLAAGSEDSVDQGVVAHDGVSRKMEDTLAGSSRIAIANDFSPPRLNQTMSDDELERLRAILAKSHAKPKRKSFLASLISAALRLFTRPKESASQKTERKGRDKDAA